jgi:transcription elongation factor Elf1
MEGDLARSDARTLLALECPECHEYTEKSLTWLNDASLLSCNACGCHIEIKSGQNRVLIDTYVDLNERWNRQFG